MKLYYDIDPGHNTVLQLQEYIEQALLPYPEAVFWPGASDEIPDDSLMFRVAYLPLSFCKQPRRALERELDKLHREWARTRRQYRNALAFAVPDVDGVEAMLAILHENKPSRKEPIDLSRIYPKLHIPQAGDGFLGQPEFKEIDIQTGEIGLGLHLRVRRMLDQICDPTISTAELEDVIGLGRTDCAGIKRILFPLDDVARWFFVFMGLPRFRDARPIWTAVADGIENRQFGVLFDERHLPLDELVEQNDVVSGQRIDVEKLSGSTGYLVWKGALG